MTFFGYFEGLPYERSNESFDLYRTFKNKLPKSTIISHIESLDAGLTSLPSFDIFTGEPLHAGIYIDGDFRFPYEFLHYYKCYNIGVPYDYEEYLTGILG